MRARAISVRLIRAAQASFQCSVLALSLGCGVISCGELEQIAPPAGSPVTDLAIRMTVNNATPSVGNVVTFTVTATNNGPLVATGVLAGDTLPAGLSYQSHSSSLGTYQPTSGVWTIGTVPAMSEVTLALRATVQTGTAGNVLLNRAGVISTDQTDSLLSNNVASASISVPAPGGATPILSDDFSGYADRAAMLNFNASGNPWSAMNQADAETGQFVYLDRDPPAGSTDGVAMEYRFIGTGSVCKQDQGGGARLFFPAGAGPRELWTELRVYFAANFVTTNTASGCGTAFPEYKFLFHNHDGNGRTNLYLGGGGSLGVQVGNALAGNTSVGAPSSHPSSLFSYFRGAWRVVRMQSSLPTTVGGNDGILRVWIDGQLVLEFTGQSAPETRHARVTIGANLNRSPVATQSIWWDYIRVYSTNPGW